MKETFGQRLARLRKEKGLTQEEVASRIVISPQAVSKWETGRSLPDAAIMLELCSLLNITVNDLLSGEVVSMENHDERTEKLLLEMIKEKEKADKRLLSVEIVIGVISSIFLFAMIAVGIVFMKMEK